MKPGVLNLSEKQGATLRLKLAWKDENGTLVDLTGYRARWVARYKADSPNAAISCDSQGDSPRITLGGTPWNIVMVVDKTTMAAVKAGVYVHDLELTAPSGEDYPLLTGRLDLAGSSVRS